MSAGASPSGPRPPPAPLRRPQQRDPGSSRHSYRHGDDAMTMFFLDLWHDLREKRLWPVAVGLIAAIIAVPVILFKPASDAAPPATVVPPSNGAATLPVVSVDSGPTVGSHLNVYSEKNPFKPMKDLAKTTATSSSGSASGNTSSGSSSQLQQRQLAGQPERHELLRRHRLLGGGTSPGSTDHYDDHPEHQHDHDHDSDCEVVPLHGRLQLRRAGREGDGLQEPGQLHPAPGRQDPVDRVHGRQRRPQARDVLHLGPGLPGAGRGQVQRIRCGMPVRDAEPLATRATRRRSPRSTAA